MRRGIYVVFIGKIRKELYSCISKDITSDEVIITEERILHIQDRHPDDYERYFSCLETIIADPDYIVQSKRPNTAVILKEMSINQEKFKVILRLKVETDPIEHKNSILSFWRIGETTWKKTIKNKKILYKKT